MNKKQIARELVRLAQELVMPADLFDGTDLQVIEFLHNNASPTDDEFHAWAEQNGLDTHKAEASAYKLAALFVEFWKGGFANRDGIAPEDVDQKELAMGIEVELEHTPNPAVAKRIALDHLAEIFDYYTRLKAMEKKAEGAAE